MTPPTVQFIPAAGIAYDQRISGTTSVADTSYGSRDTSPGSSPTITGLSAVTMRGTGGGAERVFLTFDTSGNRDTFVSNVSNGSSVYFTADGTTYSGTSISWNNFSTIAMLQADDFDQTLPTSFPTGTVYELGFIT